MSVAAQSASPISHSSQSLDLNLEKAQTSDPLNTKALTSSKRFQLIRDSLAPIQIIRCLAIACAAKAIFDSLLIPAVIFISISAFTCALKNRIAKKNPRALDAETQKVAEVATPALQRSRSTASRISTSSQQSSNDWRLHRLLSGGKQEPLIVETGLKAIKEEEGVYEAFFNGIDHQEMDLKSQYMDLLKLCYFSLLEMHRRGTPMPNTLNKGNGFSLPQKTDDYLKDKLKKYAKEEGAVTITANPDPGHAYAMETSQDLKDQKSILEKLKPSEKFDLIAQIYDKLVDQESKLGATSNISHFKENANHARQYAENCCKHEKNEVRG